MLFPLGTSIVVEAGDMYWYTICSFIDFNCNDIGSQSTVY